MCKHIEKIRSSQDFNLRNSCTELIFSTLRQKKIKKKYSCFRKCGWRGKSSPGRPQIYFNPIFSFLLWLLLLSLFSCFLCFFVCFLKLKIYILIHIRLCGRVSNKKIFTRPICRNKTTFFGLSIVNCVSKNKTEIS